MKKKNSSKEDIIIGILTYTFYTLFAFICIYPFYYMFINTISANDLSAAGKINFWPRGIHIQNYLDAGKIPGIANAFIISLGRTIIGTILTTMATAFLGYMFSRETMWKRKLLYRFMIITMYFNAGIIPWFLTMKTLGLTNNFLAYILPGIVSPFYIILTKTFVESISKELFQAAEIDGAGTMRIFRSIVIPVIKPIMATVAIFTAVGQWNSFQDTLLLMTNEKLYTLQYILYQYINQASSLKTLVNNSTQSANIEQVMATMQTATSVRMTVTVIVVLPILFVYPIFQRYFVKGIMVGAVKG